MPVGACEFESHLGHSSFGKLIIYSGKWLAFFFCIVLSLWTVDRPGMPGLSAYLGFLRLFEAYKSYESYNRISLIRLIRIIRIIRIIRLIRIKGPIKIGRRDVMKIFLI